MCVCVCYTNTLVSCCLLSVLCISNKSKLAFRPSAASDSVCVCVCLCSEWIHSLSTLTASLFIEVIMPLTALFLHTFTWACAAAIEPRPKIDGQQTSSITLQENVTHRFNCQSEGWNPQAPPLLSWYLNGERQSEVTGSRGVGRLVMTSSDDAGELKYGSERNSTFTLRPKRWDRELMCSAQNPSGGTSYNATVTLNVQFQPEILKVDAHYSETSDPGLSLILFALVRSNPPATISWVDQSGHMVANTSDFLILDSRSYPWLANHSLHVTLSSLSRNISINANNSLGSAHTNLTLTQFLQSRVEVPMFGIVTGGALGFVTLLILTLMVFFLLQKDKTKAIEDPIALHLSSKCSSDVLKVQVHGMYLPRENMSLPSHVQLNDDRALCKGQQNSKQNTLERRRVDEEEEDLSTAYAARGFARYPMVGYIYKVSSTSSDEIWL